MRAELITVGDELCRGEIVNTNASWLAAALWDLEVTVEHIITCGDLVAPMRACIENAAQRSDLVFVSGGLGPTMDDLTVDVMAEIARQRAVIHEPSAERMRTRFASAGIALVDNATRQVRCLQGSRVYDNPAGLAPAFEIQLGNALVICLPGPPRELHAIFDTHLRARVGELLQARGEESDHIARKIFRVFGRGESQIATALEGLRMEEGASLHYQVKFPETLVKLVLRHRDATVAQARLDAMCVEVEARLDGLIYGYDGDSLPAVLVRKLIDKGQSIACAESCTGGMVASLITAIPGSSACFMGACVTYSNAEKVRQLGVSEATLAAHGAVSEEVVLEMAIGVRERVGVDWGVSVSGIAGPDGGSVDKPVGTVWIAVAGPGGQRHAKKYNWPGARDQVRRLAAHWALNMVRRQLVATLESEE